MFTLWLAPQAGRACKVVGSVTLRRTRQLFQPRIEAGARKVAQRGRARLAKRLAIPFNLARDNDDAVAAVYCCPFSFQAR